MLPKPTSPTLPCRRKLLPFLASARKIVVVNAPTAAPDLSKFWAWLIATVKSGPDQLLLVVVFYTNQLARSARSQFESRATKLKSEGVDVQILRELKRTGNDTAALQWIREVVAEEGLQIDGSAAEFLIERSTVDAGSLEQEVKKIAALKNFAGRISRGTTSGSPTPTPRSG